MILVSYRLGLVHAMLQTRQEVTGGRKKAINQQSSHSGHCVSHCIDTFCVTFSSDSIFFFILSRKATSSKLISRDVTNVIKATSLTRLSHEVTDVNVQSYFFDADITQRHRCHLDFNDGM